MPLMQKMSMSPSASASVAATLRVAQQWVGESSRTAETRLETPRKWGNVARPRQLMAQALSAKEKTARARLSTEPPGTESLARIGVLLTGGEAVQTETPRETPLSTERPGRLGEAAWRRPPLPREVGRA